LDAIVAAVLAVCLRNESAKTSFFQGIKEIDWIGIITIAGATITFLLGLQFGGLSSWKSPTVIVLLVCGVLAFIIFFVTQFTISKYPIMPFRIFSQRSNLGALAVCFFDAFVFNSMGYFLPLYFQTVLLETPFKAGLLMLSLAIPLGVSCSLAGEVMKFTGDFIRLLRGGLILMTIAIASFNSFTYYLELGKVIGLLVMLGVALGPNFQAPLLALQQQLSEDDVTLATATFAFVRYLSGAMGVVLCQVVSQSSVLRSANDSKYSELPLSILNALGRGDTISPGNVTLSQNQEMALRQVKNEAMKNVWILCTVIAGLGFLSSLCITGRKMENESRIDSYRKDSEEEQS
jgi:MFS family permease